MKAYFTKDEFGAYRIPIEKQRPVFMIGPPGIGKTAIMEQIAAELGVGLVSYSMTHHTRQSALGLPYITEKEYGGRSYQVTEYTMSEIIGSIYDLMRETGLTEGILFLDEINCVSETLAPCMLQFLQYKVFGQHRVPPGWILVTAGNPPEYNKSVRDFDTVTWDRLKRIDVEPDYETWKEYAYKKGRPFGNDNEKAEVRRASAFSPRRLKLSHEPAVKQQRQGEGNALGDDLRPSQTVQASKGVYDIEHRYVYESRPA